MISDTSTPLGKTSIFEVYKKDFEESFSPLSSGDIARMSVLTPEASTHIWKPDEVGRALFVWRRDRSSLGRQADVNFEESVASARQNNKMPRVMLRRFEQLRCDLYPLQLFVNCDIVYEFQVEATAKLTAYAAAKDIYYKKSYERIKRWLQQLPLEPSQQVYVARVPQETFLVTWHEFVYHWDGFYSDRFCTLNVINDDPGCFLFFHAEKFAVWGCTYEYATQRGLSYDNFVQEPINYHDQQEKAYREAQTFRNLIREHGH